PPHDDLVRRRVAECHAQTDRQEDGEAEDPEDDLRLAHELAHAGEVEMDERLAAAHRSRLIASYSSRRCLPVSATNTSSRLACLVVSRDSVRRSRPSRSRRAGIATCGSETVNKIPPASA